MKKAIQFRPGTSAAAFIGAVLGGRATMVFADVNERSSRGCTTWTGPTVQIMDLTVCEQMRITDISAMDPGARNLPPRSPGGTVTTAVG